MSISKKLAAAGSLVCVDEGAYSDYQVTGFFVVLTDFEPMALLGEYLNENPEQRKDYSFSSAQFLAFLLAKGLLLEIAYGTLFMSEYGKSSEVWFAPNRNHGND